MDKLKKRMLHRDIRSCFSKSKGRFFSIMSLIALGSFALVGLQVAGPDMRSTGTDYFDSLRLADISVIGDYGIDAENRAAIDRTVGAERIEYGYLKDVVIEGTGTSVRIFSATDGVSEYELTDGRMPEADGEIAVASFLEGEYAIGDSFPVAEKADAAGNTVLRDHTPTIVGFVNSSELLSKIYMGQSTAGTGELGCYAVVTPDAFDSEVYMIARIRYSDMRGLDPYSTEYSERVAAHKDELNALLAEQPQERLSAIRAEYQSRIDDAQAQIDEAKAKLSDAQAELDDAQAQLDDARAQYEAGLAEYSESRAEADSQLDDAQRQFDDAAARLDAAEAEINEKSAQLEAGKAALAAARAKLDAGWQSYREGEAKLEQLRQTKAQLDASQAELDARTAEVETALGMPIDRIEAALPVLKLTLPAEQYANITALIDARGQLADGWAAYNEAAASAGDAEKQLGEAEAKLRAGEAEYAKSAEEAEAGAKALDAAREELAAGRLEFERSQAEYEEKKAAAESALAAARSELDAAADEIADGERSLTEGRDEYNAELPDAEQRISDAEQKVTDARDALSGLSRPVYALDSRREVPGSEGYRVYATVSEIVDSLADIFPIFLYFVAALVTLTTMTRFVDEERINSGTLKALGYGDGDIIKKFTIYGSAASISGAIIGIAAGHTLLPLIVCNAYAPSMTYPRIELHFYPIISLTALALALICAVLPAYAVARRELKERPAALLQPKPPEAGSEILLERIPFIWKHLSFTHKVTARNLFRYKKRMLMTIFGVCGSVTLIFAGFSVQHSISGVKDRQFGDIMKYDLIVAESAGMSEGQHDEINSMLASDDIAQHMPIRYETLTKIAGRNGDRQEMTMIVPERADGLSDYVTLCERRSGKELSLDGDGCLISERLARLLDVGAGDTITVNDAEGNELTLTVSGITEMYTGHFVFMSADYYESVSADTFLPNAHLITLRDGSADNAKAEASSFMKPGGVKGVVQNTTMMNQIDTIVGALNRIMEILIIVAIMLAAVILYNLTNINVSERIRELSTIKVLGFFNGEVTMYIYRETILLTVLGILVGYGFGDLLYMYILNIVPPDNVMFNPALGAKAFVIPLIVVSLITALLGLLVNRRLKNVDMLQALKSVE